MLWASFGLSRASSWVPQWVLGITLLLLLLQLVGELLAARSALVQTQPHAVDDRRGRIVAAAAWLSLLTLLTWLIGTAAGGALFCYVWLRWHAGERWPLAVGTAAGLGIVLWVLFSLLFGVGLYAGILWTWLN